ncbi:MAG TPA: hypothetical protein VGC04_01410 [Cellulomonas sp.]
MNPQILFELARIEHQNRVEDVERELRRRRVARRRSRRYAAGRPPSRQPVPLAPTC